MLKPFSILTLNEFRDLLRSRVSLFWIFLFPFFFLTMMLISFGQKASGKQVRIDVIDEDRTPRSEQYIATIAKDFATHDPIAGVVTRIDSPNISHGNAVLITIPAGFGASASSNTAVPVTVTYDPRSGPLVHIAANQLALITARFNAALTGRQIPVRLDAVATGTSAPPPTIDFPQFLLTGIMVMSMMSAAMNNTCVTIADRRERNTFKLMSCLPLNPTAYLLAIIVARVLVLVVASITLVFGARFIFGIDLIIDIARLAGTVCLMIIGTFMLLTLGVALSSRVTSVTNAIFICNLVYLTLLFSSDLTMPLNNLSGRLRDVLDALPTAELVKALRAVLIHGASLGTQWPAISAMLIWTAVFAAVARSAFHWHRI
jgi:ABC-2 type transport system permease protein